MEPLKTIQPELLALSSEQFAVLMPYFALFFGGILAIIFSVLRIVNPKWTVFLLSGITLIATMHLSSGLVWDDPVILLNNMMISDSYRCCSLPWTT